MYREDETDEPVQVVPPVVAVVVTNNPGPWLEETLGSLAAQDYPALGVLVLDNASRRRPDAAHRGRDAEGICPASGR